MKTERYLNSIRAAHSGDGTATAVAEAIPPMASETAARSCNVEGVVLETVTNVSLLELIEMILKDRARLHRVIRDPRLHAELVPKFLAIALTAFLFFGTAATLVFQSAGMWPELTAIAEKLRTGERLIRFNAFGDSQTVWTPWLNGAAWKLMMAYSVGLIAATGVCLPSLYFYGLLAGVRMSLLDVTVHALKAKATSAVALVGILPVYAALGMGMVIFDAPRPVLHGSLYIGLMLPFIAGLWGTYSLYVGFAGLCDTLPEERRERRECFLRRLVLSWAACYTAVSPVMIHTLWQAMGT